MPTKMHTFWRTSLAAACALAIVVSWPARCAAYSVLSHEAIIDSAWDTNIKPVLLKQFPTATPDELRQAHGYAYGGAIIQDLGYYPHGSILFSDLTHYVRSGDFVLALLRDARESKDLNDYAFALGALAHYAADIAGHPMATNRAVPLLYPKLKKRFGNIITYEDDPLAHVKTEFGFDVLEIAQQRYASDSYHDFIGFEVAKPLLEKAFQETYGLPLKVVLSDEDQVLNSYRRAVSKQIPQATRIAWTLKKDEIRKDAPGITKKKFLYNLSRASYEKQWGKNYKRPTFWEKFLAFIYKLLPKIGPLRVLQFRTPTPQTQKLFESSFNATLDRYRVFLSDEAAGHLKLINDNFDTGDMTGPGKYRMNDEAHAKLLGMLADENFASASPEVREELLRFFSDPDAPYATKHDVKAWARVQAQLEQLKAAPPAEALPSTQPAKVTLPR
ncbi:MAG TPA: zinc dependent phospholipase C family protein [Candidatus Acidoferrum sp.]|nr:zinc dependent phospholipase C family protein [Candidatus Acidoferrum sp.]